MPWRRWRARAAADADRQEEAIERLQGSLARLTDVRSLQSTIAARLAELAAADAAVFFEHDDSRARYRAGAMHPGSGPARQPDLAEGRGIRVVRRLEARPLPIRGDTRELGQVFMNILLNACEAMPEGGELQVQSAAAAEGDDPPRAVMSISDSGPGMPPDMLGRVFDPFFTTKHTGTGLGLPICLEIMSRHGGRIRVDSRVGAGTTVVLELPLAAHGHDSGC